MVKSYCVKEKKQTECVPGSERYVKAKNGRTMMKCQCASCGITKSKFVKSESTGGAIRKKSTGPYCGVGEVPAGRKRGTEAQCIDQRQVRYYGINAIPREILETLKKSKLTKKQLENLTKKKGN